MIFSWDGAREHVRFGDGGTFWRLRLIGIALVRMERLHSDVGCNIPYRRASKQSLSIAVVLRGRHLGRSLCHTSKPCAGEDGYASSRFSRLQPAHTIHSISWTPCSRGDSNLQLNAACSILTARTLTSGKAQRSKRWCEGHNPSMAAAAACTHPQSRRATAYVWRSLGSV